MYLQVRNVAAIEHSECTGAILTQPYTFRAQDRHTWECDGDSRELTWRRGIFDIRATRIIDRQCSRSSTKAPQKLEKGHRMLCLIKERVSFFPTGKVSIEGIKLAITRLALLDKPRSA